ncbi:hypothetical protein FHS85_004576 [Rhodoligotrophos appendicifer]|uniref:hypothetical protein n=1 Tax=Rhodoligotrophos appendicifer TaxID=987056 RepID=UPI001FEA689C|nr:hypothetical protein [Rhodoligotrophos appendicifer]
MMQGLRLAKTVLQVPCTIEIENTWESLHAHVQLEGDVTVEPGDEVHVQGGEIVVPYGERCILHRVATVTKASSPERLWVKMTGDLEFMELLEFSFSSGEKL